MTTSPVPSPAHAASPSLSPTNDQPEGVAAIPTAQAAIASIPTTPTVASTKRNLSACKSFRDQLSAQGYNITEEAKPLLDAFLRAVRASYKDGGSDVTKVKTAFAALQEKATAGKLTSSSNCAEALSCIFASVAKFAEDNMKASQKTWEDSALQQFFNPKEGPKVDAEVQPKQTQGPSTRTKVIWVAATALLLAASYYWAAHQISSLNE